MLRGRWVPVIAPWLPQGSPVCLQPRPHPKGPTSGINQDRAAESTAGKAGSGPWWRVCSANCSWERAKGCGARFHSSAGWCGACAGDGEETKIKVT